MELLPCEIIQHIASSLLPRSQCRLAITSRQNYDWLYSPLLRWHAKKAVISVPKCAYSKMESLVEINPLGKLILYRSFNCGGDEIEIYNLTTMETYQVPVIELPKKIIDCEDYLVSYLLDIKDFFKGFYAHISKELLLVIYESEMNRLNKLPNNILIDILKYVDFEDWCLLREVSYCTYLNTARW